MSRKTECCTTGSNAVIRSRHGYVHSSTVPFNWTASLVPAYMHGGRIKLLTEEHPMLWIVWVNAKDTQQLQTFSMGGHRTCRHSWVHCTEVVFKLFEWWVLLDDAAPLKSVFVRAERPSRNAFRDHRVRHKDGKLLWNWYFFLEVFCTSVSTYIRLICTFSSSNLRRKNILHTYKQTKTCKQPAKVVLIYDETAAKTE